MNALLPPVLGFAVLSVFRRIAVILLVSAAFSALAQAPSASDATWQQAIAKFDGRRAALLRDVNSAAQRGPFRPDWQSLKRYTVPDWYEDAKFGIFIHWGVYSVPAFGNEWYPRDMYLQGSDEYRHHLAVFGPQTSFGYKDFVPRFRAERFDAERWAELFRAAGARYVMPVAEHHDGFAMYRSELSDWCAATQGPHRDVVGELSAAVRRRGMRFGTSSHRAEHYFFLNGGRAFPSDVQDPRYAAFYGPAHPGPSEKNDWAGHPDPAYLDDWMARATEIVEKYRPDIFWFDWWIGKPEFQPYLQRFAAFYYNDADQRQATVAINYKNQAFPEGTAVLDIERGQLETIRPLFWQTDTSVSDKSWGYIDGDTYKSPQAIIWQLVDIVSKNGSLLLNVGPRSDGTIPEAAEQLLRSIGGWLNVNGDAIYGTRPWKVYGEGPTHVVGGAFNDTKTQQFTASDIRFTIRAQTLYAIAMAWPNDGRLTIHALAANRAPFKVNRVTLLGSRATIRWSQTGDGLQLQLPSQPAGEYAFAFRIE